MIPNKAKITICPAVILANNLTAKAKGLVNKPNNSTTNITGVNHHGTPCGTKFAKYLKNPLWIIPPIWITKKDIVAKVAVTEIFEVAVAP